jgi:hypothetical protein
MDRGRWPSISPHLQPMMASKQDMGHRDASYPPAALSCDEIGAGGEVCAKKGKEGVAR